jgi:hypothetical protein
LAKLLLILSENYAKVYNIQEYRQFFRLKSVKIANNSDDNNVDPRFLPVFLFSGEAHDDVETAEALLLLLRRLRAEHGEELRLVPVDVVREEHGHGDQARRQVRDPRVAG